jgi:hypothetical protein
MPAARKERTMFDDKLTQDILTVMAKHFPYTHQELEEAYRIVDSFDKTIRMAMIANRNAVPLHMVAIHSVEILPCDATDTLLDFLDVDHLEELWS